MRKSAVVAVASSTAPGVCDTRIPVCACRNRNRLLERWRTSSRAFLDVDLIVTRAVVCDPPDGPSRSEGTNDFLVENADPGRRIVVAVYAYYSVVFPTWLQPRKEICPVWGVHSLSRGGE